MAVLVCGKNEVVRTEDRSLATAWRAWHATAAGVGDGLERIGEIVPCVYLDIYNTYLTSLICYVQRWAFRIYLDL